MMESFDKGQIRARIEQMRRQAFERRERWNGLVDALDLSRDHRSENIRALLYIFEAKQSDLAGMLRTNQTHISKLVTGKELPSDDVARTIEIEFGLPEGWLDRDNQELLTLTNEEVRLVREIQACGVDAIKSLTEAIHTIRLGKK